MADWEGWFSRLLLILIKNDELAKVRYEIDVLVKKINEERLNIELDALKAMKDPVQLDVQPALLDMLSNSSQALNPRMKAIFQQRTQSILCL